MNVCTALLLVSILWCTPYSEATDYERIVHVYDSSSTMCNSSAIDINSADFNDAIKNSTEIKFCHNELILTRSWIVQQVTQVKFSGTVILKCSENTGIQFEHITDLIINNMQLVNCSGQFQNSSIRASMFINSAHNFSISKLVILDSIGVGLYVKNVRGKAEIANSQFKQTSAEGSCRRTDTARQDLCSVGVHLELSGETGQDTHKVDFKLLKCNFENAIRTAQKCKGCKLLETYQGGGLRMLLQANAVNNSITVRGCTFKNRSANLIGGIDIVIGSNAAGNSILISNTSFENNTCLKKGGGALAIRFENLIPAGNNIKICNSSFTGNLARYGGGVFLRFSGKLIALNHSTKNSVDFIRCNWTNNGARYGSAVDAIADTKGSDLALKMTFKNSIFKWHFISTYIITKKETTVFGQGTLSLKHISAEFQGRTMFTNNSGSPLFLRSSNVEFGRNSDVEFSGNRGLNGGAITLLDSSTITAGSGSVLKFTNNTAYFKGGAIFHRFIDSHEYLTNRKCFIQHKNSNKKGKPRYIFTDNAAGSQFSADDSPGPSIYATTLVPCNKQCNHYRGSETYIAGKESTFDCVGKFKYNKNRTFEVTTSAWIIKLDDATTSPLSIIPGKVTLLPVRTTDELQHQLQTVYKAVLWKLDNDSTNTSAEVDEPYRYTHVNTTVILGEPNNVYKLSLTTEHDREIKIDIEVKIEQCPPGYVLNEKRCSCLAAWNFEGIPWCNTTKFHAMLQRGYWIGYRENESVITSVCPYGFCNNSDKASEYPLPELFNETTLDLLVCGESRTGRLCGQCRDNTSVYYHSSTYRCGSNRLCSIGWLLYALSELLPVTFIFLTIIAFDTQLTSGSVNGLILYYQLSNSMLILVNNIPKLASYLYFGHTFIANIFDLNTFSGEKLGFCLWKGATTLDIIAFKYVTVAYSLVLVILTVCVMTTCGHRLSCSKVRKLKQKKRQVTNSVIHGLSGFFILCYSQCATASLRLLRSVTYSSTNNSASKEWYVLYNGSIKYFGASHLQYALPALFFTFVLAILPPTALLSYPLCYRVFRLLRIEETKFSKLLCRLVPLEKLKPFFDSFQGSFKDEHRYTSGLYFVYRLILVCLAVFTTPNSNLFYILLEIQLLGMIFIHAYFQPYKKRKHNRQDLFLFVNLAVINALTIFELHRSSDDIDQVNIVLSTQMLLLTVPTFIIVLKIGLYLFKVVRAHRKKNEVLATPSIEEISEREGMDDDCFVSSNSYSIMNESDSVSYI